MNPGELEILYEDNHLLAVNKPAMLPTMGVAADRPSLLATAKEWLRIRYEKPGNVYLGVVSRLDAPVTGVTLLAKTSKAAARLTEAFRTRKVEKVYWAVIDGLADPPSGSLEHHLRHDDRHRRVHVTHANCPDAKIARLGYRTLAALQDLSLLEVQLETGRKHQIRVQLAKAIRPVVGDRKYGSELELRSGIALHARRLVLQHPVRREPLEIAAPLPAVWHKRREFAELIRLASAAE